ncbi:MAG TPA: hypothetical protein VJ577_07105 [Burkholderiaceae bacterium]|nr:hypothetical protein [Burkholderiaceae bacterium]
MNDLASLGLYFPLSAKAKGTRSWHRLSTSNLAHHLLSYARRTGIHQARLHHTRAGYLPFMPMDIGLGLPDRYGKMSSGGRCLRQALQPKSYRSRYG